MPPRVFCLYAYTYRLFRGVLSMRIPTIFSEALSLASYSISSIIIDSYLKRKRGKNSFQQEHAGLEVIKRVIKYILGRKRL